ncbi:MAG: hypothetical protein IPK25_16360 [Saprospiraceae bacterium]|nr:hypothetical protein [Saprospiraceae bacterium]
MHRINLNALLVSDTQTLADICNIVFLSNSRDVLNRSESKFVKKDAALFGGIDFQNSDSITDKESEPSIDQYVTTNTIHRNQNQKVSTWEYHLKQRKKSIQLD